MNAIPHLLVVLRLVVVEVDDVRGVGADKEQVQVRGRSRVQQCEQPV